MQRLYVYRGMSDLKRHEHMENTTGGTQRLVYIRWEQFCKSANTLGEKHKPGSGLGSSRYIVRAARVAKDVTIGDLFRGIAKGKGEIERMGEGVPGGEGEDLRTSLISVRQ